MTYALAPRITMPYVDISGIFNDWATHCKQMIVYEHTADKNVNKTHCHVLIIDSGIKEEAFKRKFKKMYPAIDTTKGNAFWKWASEYGTPDIKFITYMSKGCLSPKYVHNISNDDIEYHKSLWTDKQKDSIAWDKMTGKYDEYEYMKKDLEKDFERIMMNGVIDLQLIRSWTMHWYWVRDGRLPPASTYKRNACSLFLYAVERHELTGKPFTVALRELQELWY